jgi:hypothetical protein
VPPRAPAIRYSERRCGCSSMAEHQLPKLTVRVRFPSPAQIRDAPVRIVRGPGAFRILTWGPSPQTPRCGGRSERVGTGCVPRRSALIRRLHRLPSRADIPSPASLNRSRGLGRWFVRAFVGLGHAGNRDGPTVGCWGRIAKVAVNMVDAAITPRVRSAPRMAWSPATIERMDRGCVRSPTALSFSGLSLEP